MSFFCYYLFLAKATFEAMAQTFTYLTPDLWKETIFQKTPYQEYSDFLMNTNQQKVSKRE